MLYVVCIVPKLNASCLEQFLMWILYMDAFGIDRVFDEVYLFLYNVTSLDMQSSH